ncbi:kinase-like protein [Lophiostoma macrostomum CBS 122681]|uniref:EKC/KEOPS complex subunit BUD32 n=1 Tax=Lophiostoma macrostomum CBS 122681 TaxID=1314788 RepID=A0A6A6TM15_9PLEO|nr:kinase-like protein [Lophiostoma macrostomum CBS 122681]
MNEMATISEDLLPFAEQMIPYMNQPKICNWSAFETSSYSGFQTIDWGNLMVSSYDSTSFPGYVSGCNLVKAIFEENRWCSDNVETKDHIAQLVMFGICKARTEKRLAADFKGLNLVWDLEMGPHSQGKTCIVKVLDPLLSGKGPEREIQILRRLEHPNIVAYRDSHVAEHLDETPWLCMEFCQYGTLDQLLSRYVDTDTRIPEAFLWHVFASLASAIQYCHFGPESHASGHSSWDMVVHRDITLRNIFLGAASDPACSNSGHTNRYPSIKLGDFGCAVPRSDVTSGGITFKEDCMGECQGGAAHLPLMYGQIVPPEGGGVNPSSDVYQMGVVMLCLLLHMNEPRTALETVGRAPRWCNYDGGYSTTLVEFVQDCLEYDVADRAKSENLAVNLKFHVEQEFKAGRLTVGEDILTPAIMIGQLRPPLGESSSHIQIYVNKFT